MNVVINITLNQSLLWYKQQQQQLVLLILISRTTMSEVKKTTNIERKLISSKQTITEKHTNGKKRPHE